jgi:predicted  nucleic acid-binding Zn-ribbon protein
MTDIVERLRSWANAQTNHPDLLREAAEEIERLRDRYTRQEKRHDEEVANMQKHLDDEANKIERLEAALRWIAVSDSDKGADMRARARAALEGK